MGLGRFAHDCQLTIGTEWSDQLGQQSRKPPSCRSRLPVPWLLVSCPSPFGLVMIEAMSCGTPVIAFNHGSVPEVIEDGKTGILAEVGDVESIWTERVQVIRSESAAASQAAALDRRLKRTEVAVRGLTPPPGPGRTQFTTGWELERAVNALLAEQNATGLLTVNWERQETSRTHYVGPGRGGPNRRQTTEQSVRYQITAVTRDDAAIEAEIGAFAPSLVHGFHARHVGPLAVRLAPFRDVGRPTFLRTNGPTCMGNNWLAAAVGGGSGLSATSILLMLLPLNW